MDSTLNQTPKANRIHIAFFGLRNAGKSTLVNAFTNQQIAIVSEIAGTTTDPVSKAMEILPLGPCLVTDTAGLDDVGELGTMRVEKTLDVLATTDVAVWVWGDAEQPAAEPNEVRQPKAAHGPYHAFAAECVRRKIAVLEYHRGESVEGLKQRIAALKLVDDAPGLLERLVAPGDRVVCVCPIDESAPKGRLILPQVQVIRECLDRHVACTVCQVEELEGVLRLFADKRDEDVRCGTQAASQKTLVITDSQAFKDVAATVSSFGEGTDRAFRLTSFSILFARQKGDLKAFFAGLEAVKNLKDGDSVLIAEGCTHHRQCNDIGTTKIPKALAKLTGGKRLEFTFASGTFFPIETVDASALRLRLSSSPSSFSLVVQCGGCMLTRREMLRRIEVCRSAGVPIVNYGILLAGAVGLDLSDLGCDFYKEKSHPD